ncbi:hypothetical protein ACFQAV_11350 [Companilactobacillus huachuanensis]|uniref:Lipoprotein n=1 Tax=Companilactobacillus huachuanensis TaxID=2559914 RepID=A0ABW1RPR2_9LACO|nr:hypothetical protein [Companilactobacillus huachuanensis]
MQNNSRISRQKKRKKPPYKKWWFWLIIAIFIIGGIGNIIDPVKNDNSTSAQTTNEKKGKASKNKARTYKAKKNDKSVKKSPNKKNEVTTTPSTKAKVRDWNFNLITLGMTKKEVEDILGKPTSESLLGNLEYGKDKLTFSNGKLYDGTPDNIKNAAIQRDKPEKLKAFAKRFGTKDAESVQKLVGSAYASKYIDGQGMTYAWTTDYGTLLRVDDTQNRITTVYLYDSNTNGLGQELYQGQTILQKAPTIHNFYN